MAHGIRQFFKHIAYFQVSSITAELLSTVGRVAAAEVQAAQAEQVAAQVYNIEQRQMCKLLRQRRKQHRYTNAYNGMDLEV